MKKLFIVTSVILAAGCATVKENAEEKNESNDYGTSRKITYTDEFGEERNVYEDNGNQSIVFVDTVFGSGFTSIEDFQTELQRQEDANCRNKVSVFPNPISTFATIEIDYWKGKKIEGTIFETIPISFQYNLIFDQKIIHRDIVQGNKTQITIPEHLLQKEGVYTLAFEFFKGELPACKNSISFMVIKTR